jgi:hypothetical protein
MDELEIPCSGEALMSPALGLAASELLAAADEGSRISSSFSETENDYFE